MSYTFSWCGAKQGEISISIEVTERQDLGLPWNVYNYWAGWEIPCFYKTHSHEILVIQNEADGDKSRAIIKLERQWGLFWKNIIQFTAYMTNTHFKYPPCRPRYLEWLPPRNVYDENLISISNSVHVCYKLHFSVPYWSICYTKAHLSVQKTNSII